MKHLHTSLTADLICNVAWDDDQLATLAADWSPRMVAEEAELAVLEALDRIESFVPLAVRKAALTQMVVEVEQRWMNLIADAEENEREMVRDGLMNPDRRSYAR